MSLQKTTCLLLGVAVCGSLPVAATRPACAEPPEGVVRTFGFMADAGTYVDGLFDGEDSVGVVVAGGPTTITDMSFEGTIWIHQSTTHITKGGDSTPGVFWWLLDENTPEPPPAGAFALTGAKYCVQEVYYVMKQGSEYIIDPYGWTDIFVVVTAVFTR